ncbi:hypothetical protein ACWZHB_07090 [Nocardia sp. FBN12]|uniref:Excreted virulence factor EspC, type VII ESX diderm n=1 Tax=Nocardia halotolerans TaxID=1755878 RepID=A0ABV8VGT8_9NOCA
MAGYFQVDIDVLASTVQSLKNSEQVLGDAMKALESAGDGDIGTTGLNDAAANFQRSWKFGIERIIEAAITTAEGVSQCHDAYVSADSAFARALDQATQVIDAQGTADGNATGVQR